MAGYFAATMREETSMVAGQLGQGHAMGKVVALALINREKVNHETAAPIWKKRMLVNGEIPSLTGFSEARIPPLQKVPLHSHQTMHEVFFVKSGSGIFKIDGVNHEVSDGTCIHLAPKEKHEINNTSGDKDLVLLYFGVAVAPR